ncbi:heterokaryon incompatibility protein-domain-containing protein [Pisolithus croceorrhizus]|nr:heterokaryon incompatibility protein-domain-containing protein [Pisolithus croceorrhizus]
MKTRVHSAGLDAGVLPATIRDAIALTRQIGERYIWIDALCILQDSPTDKGAQICIMDLIYSRAVFTIFAASGQSAFYQLSGIHLAIPLPPLSEALTESNWNTRGWTFQEILLSRRRLVFTKHQMYFECTKDVWCEDVVAESKTLSSCRPLFISGTAVSLPNYPEASYMTVRDYVAAVASYSQRRLTVESDIVAAITALAKRSNLETANLLEPSLYEALVRKRVAECWMAPTATIHARPDESLVTAWYMVNDDRSIIRLDVETILGSWTVTCEYGASGQGGRWHCNTDSACSACYLSHHSRSIRHSRANAGRIILPASTASPTTFEFIVLSRCDGIRGIYDELTWGGRYYGCLLHVMAVQGTPDDSRVRERVGVGVVVEPAWIKSHKEETTVRCRIRVKPSTLTSPPFLMLRGQRLAEPPRAVLHASKTMIAPSAGYTIFERKSACLPMHTLQNLLNVEQIICDGSLEEERACPGLLLEITVIALFVEGVPSCRGRLSNSWAAQSITLGRSAPLSKHSDGDPQGQDDQAEKELQRGDRVP